MTQPTPLTAQQLDEIETRAAALYEFATVADPEGQDALDVLAGTDVPVLLAEIRRLQTQRRFLIGQLQKKDAASGAGDKALREFLTNDAPAAAVGGEDTRNNR